VLPATIPLPGALTLDEREARVLAFMAEHGLEYPVVLKPDAGQRGSGVAIVHRAEDVRDRLERAPVDLVVQEFVTGEEFGVFYARQPGEERGEVFSITEKRRPSVTGDGRRTVEELILDDDRAPAMAKVYFENLSARLTEVPAAGEAVCLTEVGAHARGTVFLDGNHLHTPELEARIDALSRRVDGFYFGRYDILVPSAEHLSRGEGLRIIELNGLTSEATHIYDARCPLSRAYRTLGAQWRRAFRIGRANRAAGAPTTSVFALLGMTLGFLRTARRRKAA